jgi:hypothetical protein
MQWFSYISEVASFLYPKSADTSRVGINDHNELVGYYQTKTISGPDQSFKATY